MSERETLVIGFDTRPIPMQITPTLKVAFQADPSNSEGWRTLLGFQMPKVVKVPANATAAAAKRVADENAANQAEVTDAVLGALVSMCHTPHDGDALKDANLGLFTLAAVVQGYVQAVTAGFPTQP